MTHLSYLGSRTGVKWSNPKLQELSQIQTQTSLITASHGFRACSHLVMIRFSFLNIFNYNGIRSFTILQCDTLRHTQKINEKPGIKPNISNHLVLNLSSFFCVCFLSQLLYFWILCVSFASIIYGRSAIHMFRGPSDCTALKNMHGSILLIWKEATTTQLIKL